MGRLLFTTAIVVIPPDAVWPAIQTVRTKHDAKVRRWMSANRNTLAAFAARVSILWFSRLFQSKNATEAIALDRFSVFISTRCQPSSRRVAWSGCVILPRT